MTIYTIIEYTPSDADYDRCVGSYYSYIPSELEIAHYEEYEEAMSAAKRTDRNNEITILINGVPVDDILELSEDNTLQEQARNLKSQI